MQRTLKKQFCGNGKPCKYEARIAELERMLGQLHAENELLKKAFAMSQKKIREERIKSQNKTKPLAVLNWYYKRKNPS